MSYTPHGATGSLGPPLFQGIAYPLGSLPTLLAFQLEFAIALCNHPFETLVLLL